MARQIGKAEMDVKEPWGWQETLPSSGGVGRILTRTEQGTTLHPCPAHTSASITDVLRAVQPSAPTSMQGGGPVPATGTEGGSEAQPSTREGQCPSVRGGKGEPRLSSISRLDAQACPKSG